MLELISRIAASDKSILVSSHILQDMEKVCQHVIIINSGRAITQGPMSVLLDQGRDRKRMQVRGDPKALLAFTEQLRKGYEVMSVSEEFGQMTIILVNGGSSAPLLDMAKRSGVQVRSYAPDKLTLEGAFIRSVTEGA
jgi:ABC-2 type transport system ATP-binding protein